MSKVRTGQIGNTKGVAGLDDKVMPWKARTAMDERKALLAEVQRGEESVAELSRKYGVSRKTIYQWKQRRGWWIGAGRRISTRRR